MTKHQHLYTTTFTLLALALWAPTAACATSGSLLSGYGGPGQGSQAILGSALLNGPSGGSPGSGSATTTTAAMSGGASSLAQPGRSPSRSNASRTSRASGATTGRRAKSSTGGSSAYPVRDEASSSTAPVEGSTVGLSGADLAYLVLALVALAATAMLTRGLASGGRGGNAHG